jgi:hypothetical protein
MSLLDMFRSKPKQCTSCGNPSSGLHVVYSGQRGGKETDRLCTECLVSRLAVDIRDRRVLFTEPLTSDGYSFTPFGEVGNTGLTQERVRLALSSSAATCADCSSERRHVWMPLGDLDDGAMQRQPSSEYYPIPLEPHLWKQSVPLCTKHMAQRLGAFLHQKGWHILTFRFPASPGDGYYY